MWGEKGFWTFLLLMNASGPISANGNTTGICQLTNVEIIAELIFPASKVGHLGPMWA